MKTLAEWVDHHGREQPEKIALATSTEAMSYGELAHQMRALAAPLKKGERVDLSTANPLTFVPRYLAAHWAGAIAAPTPLFFELWPPVAERPTPVAQFSDPADLLFTSGTTGQPKGVVLTHRNLLAAIDQINAFIGNGPEDRELMPLPLHHSFGLGRLRCNLRLGATLLLSDGMKRLGDLFRLAEEWQATGMALVPAGVALLLRTAAPRLAALNLNYLEIGSSPMARSQKEALCALLPSCRLCMHYGLTEASRSTFLSLHEAGDRLDSIGRPAAGVEIDLVEGELYVRGGAVAQEGWLATGDLGWRDDEGYLYLSGRKGEMIDVGGQKVAPLEVEAALLSHPAVEECACVGVADPHGICHEVVKAYLVGGEVAPHELTSFLRSRLDPYKVPALFEWVEALPRTPSGKLLRSQLKKGAP